jgi:N-carbamoylputrescine amidase
MSGKSIRVGAVQIDTRPGHVQQNLRHAADLVENAASLGAQLVLLPELMPGGYLLTEAIWDCAERFNGPTVGWLTALARRLGIYLGTSFLEADGEDYYNTFALADPHGSIAGKVRKSPPASLEAFFYTAGHGPHVIETAIGRIGVGICYENLLFERLEGLYDASADLVLQPTAAGRLKPLVPGDLTRFDRMVEMIPAFYAKSLGVPVILANRTGPIETSLPGGMGDFNSDFPGLSAIVDSDHSVKARMGAEEGVIVADVTLDPSRKAAQPPRRMHDLWAFPVPWFATIWPETQVIGEAAYANNPVRKQRAASC